MLNQIFVWFWYVLCNHNCLTCWFYVIKHGIFQKLYFSGKNYFHHFAMAFLQKNVASNHMNFCVIFIQNIQIRHLNEEKLTTILTMFLTMPVLYCRPLPNCRLRPHPGRSAMVLKHHDRPSPIVDLPLQHFNRYRFFVYIFILIVVMYPSFT